MNQRVTPETLLADQPLWRVCTQKQTGGEIHIRHIRSPDLVDLARFVRRLEQVETLAHLSMYEVYEVLRDDRTGAEALRIRVGDINKQWPAVAIRKHEGIHRERANLPKELPAPPPEQLALPSPASEIKKESNGFKAAIATVLGVTEAARKQEPKMTEQQRPVRKYFYKVA